MIEKINNKLKTLDGNYKKENNVYISSNNIKKIMDYIKNDKIMFSILITPYLINEKTGALYELLYYEQNIEIIEEGLSNYVDYNINNLLPKEVTDNFYPKINVNKTDCEFLIKYLNHYFNKMDNLKFKDVKNSHKELIDTKLYYQVF